MQQRNDNRPVVQIRDVIRYCNNEANSMDVDNG